MTVGDLLNIFCKRRRMSKFILGTKDIMPNAYENLLGWPLLLMLSTTY